MAAGLEEKAEVVVPRIGCERATAEVQVDVRGCERLAERPSVLRTEGRTGFASEDPKAASVGTGFDKCEGSAGADDSEENLVAENASVTKMAEAAELR